MITAVKVLFSDGGKEVQIIRGRFDSPQQVFPLGAGKQRQRPQ